MISWPMKVLKTVQSAVLHGFIHELTITVGNEDADHFVDGSAIPEVYPDRIFYRIQYCPIKHSVKHIHWTSFDDLFRIHYLNLLKGVTTCRLYSLK